MPPSRKRPKQTEGDLPDGTDSSAGSTQAPKGKGKRDDDEKKEMVPLDANFQLKLPTFEGPLDLLLHLIQKHELNILDLPIAFVVERYILYLNIMEKLDLDIASEYLVMAATLAHIKSKMLLPPDPSQQQDEEEAEEELDPRAELIKRLLEYQKYKGAAEQLLNRGVAGRDVFTRGMDAPEATGEAPLASLGLFKLLDAFHAVMKRANQDLAFQITAEGVSIQDRMSQLTERMSLRKRCTFEELFDDARSIYEVVVTFLAILEMAKRRLTRIYQADVLAPIHLELLVSLDAIGSDDDAPYVITSDGDAAVALPGEDPLGEALEQPDGPTLDDASDDEDDSEDDDE
jgi:segregation and condensation protein A